MNSSDHIWQSQWFYCLTSNSVVFISLVCVCLTSWPPYLLTFDPGMPWSCFLTLTLCWTASLFSPKIPSACFSWLQICCCTAPLTLYTSLMMDILSFSEDVGIDMNDAAKCSSVRCFPSVRDWTRSVLCIGGLEIQTNGDFTLNFPLRPKFHWNMQCNVL